MHRYVLILALAACGGTSAPVAGAPKAPDAAHEVSAGPPVAAGHADHQAATPPPDGHGDHGAADPHAGHHMGGADHMGAMEATRERLRSTLGASYCTGSQVRYRVGGILGVQEPHEPERPSEEFSERFGAPALWRRLPT